MMSDTELIEKVNNIQKKHKQNFRIECFYDEGFTILIGDHTNGFTHKQNFETFRECLEFLSIVFESI